MNLTLLTKNSLVVYLLMFRVCGTFQLNGGVLDAMVSECGSRGVEKRTFGKFGGSFANHDVRAGEKVGTVNAPYVQVVDFLNPGHSNEGSMHGI